MKVCIIALWFGELPTTYKAWEYSAGNNPLIDFLFVTDRELSTIYRNIHILKTDLNSVRKKLRCMLHDESIVLDRAYKLCDYKPAYGELFTTLISNYDYWGYCDIDVVFGSLMTFFERYHLSEYDRFLWLGHLSLYRNTEALRKLYRRSEDWEKTCHTTGITVFDESKTGVYQAFANAGRRQFEKAIFVDICHRIRRMTSFLIYNTDRIYRNEIFYLHAGKLYRRYWQFGKCTDSEILYMHFQKRRMNNNLDWEKRFDVLSISEHGYDKWNSKEELTLAKVKQLNPYRGRICESIEAAVYPYRADKQYLYIIRWLKIKLYPLYKRVNASLMSREDRK